MNPTGELDLIPRRPALRYHGGKFRLAPWVISHFSEHEAYVEVFGGAAGVLLRKPRSPIEVYNDLDKQVFGFFQVLRDPVLKARLVELIDLTPFSRDEFDLTYERTEDAVEAARRFVARCYFGHGTCGIDPADSNGFRSCDIRAGKSYAREWAGVPEAIAIAADRMRGVTIENLDFRRLIPKFDSPQTLFYADPPYPMSTRKAGGKGYVHEMSLQEHEQLAWLLKHVSARVVISGYECALYNEIYAGWRTDAKKTTANGQVGAVPRVERLWMNF